MYISLSFSLSLSSLRLTLPVCVSLLPESGPSALLLFVFLCSLSSRAFPSGSQLKLDSCGRAAECRIKDNGRLQVSGVTLPSMAAEEPAPPAAPVPADPAKPQKKRSPNRLVVEEALNDDNSEPWLQMLCYSHQKQIWTKGELC